VQYPTAKKNRNNVYMYELAPIMKRKWSALFFHEESILIYMSTTVRRE
jgi:hypothetical protein